MRAGYEPGSTGYRWMTDVYERRLSGKWSDYACTLYERLRDVAVRDGWIAKLRYLLYEGDVIGRDARRLDGLKGVLLQSSKETVADGTKRGRATGWSSNGSVKAVQEYEGHGCAGWAPPVPGTQGALFG